MSLLAAAAVGLVACSAPSAGQAGFLEASGVIDSRLSGDPQVTLRLGTTICKELAAGTTLEQIETDSQRYAQGEGTITRDQAAKIVAAARQHLC